MSLIGTLFWPRQSAKVTDAVGLEVDDVLEGFDEVDDGLLDVDEGLTEVDDDEDPEPHDPKFDWQPASQ
jgi:hypothetical protein